MKRWHELEATQVLDSFNVDATNGLSHDEAEHRLSVHGPNQLRERNPRGPWKIFWEQFAATMVVILVVAALLSWLLGDRKDAIAIVIIVILNAILGHRQEYKAEKAMAALKAMAVPNVRVLREGQVVEVSAHAVAPGDILILEAGNVVPADARVIESKSLRTQEASLTGESQPVSKTSHGLEGEALTLADRKNMVFMGTFVTYGRGRAIVTATGMETELGRIADMIQTVGNEPTPLQNRLAQVGQGLAGAALAIVGIVFLIGIWRGENLREMFLLAISLAVAAVPEGLPAVVTITLALGSQRLLRRKALIRKLPAVETLGSVTVICTDKTGTLTQNRMEVSLLSVPGDQVQFSLEAVVRGLSVPSPASEIESVGAGSQALTVLLVGGALCNDAVFQGGDDCDRRDPQAMGEPTENALIMAAARAGYWKPDLQKILPRVGEIPFDSERKRMTTWHRIQEGGAPFVDALKALSPQGGAQGNGGCIAFCKGGSDGLLTVCSRILTEGRAEPLDEVTARRILDAGDALASRGMRVLGLAFRVLSGVEGSLPVEQPVEDVERDLTFVGLFGLIDPPRPEARSSVALCRSAGIRPVMITGDHPLTALYIARELGLEGDGTVLSGDEVAESTDEELEQAVEKVSVYARVSPEHKLRIVQALQKNHHIVAMTGDGVNDAPALKKAEIGVAMGVTGTDVSKEVADMVLLDDNFATIVAAVQEGRAIYDNIRKFLKYMLTSNSGELWVMLIGPILGMPLPLLPLQILWINLVTDGLPALALGVEPAEPDIMRRPPLKPEGNIFGGGLGRHILWVGVLMGAIPLAAGYACWRGQDLHWQTIVFTILTFCQMSHVMAVRSSHVSLFRQGLLTNKALLGAVTLTVFLQFAVIYSPFLRNVFHTSALSFTELVTCIGLSSIIFWAVEIEKTFVSRRMATQGTFEEHL